MERSERLGRLRQVKIAKGKRDFWEFCKLVAPDFYFDGRDHLKLLADTLQALFEDRIILEDGKWVVVPNRVYTRNVCNQIYIQMPPRHGKTRTLTLFCAWVLGNDPTHKFMYTSYNDESASDTSRFVRDCISQVKLDPTSFVFSDFFKSRLQADNKAVGKWALAGMYFNFIAAGKGGSVTGKGCDTLIVDDPVKNDAEALNEAESDKTWTWFTDTLLSRIEEGGKIIVNHTRWPRRDLVQRLKDKYSGKAIPPYYELIMPAYDGEKMLCEDILSYDSYLSKQELTEEEIFQANYNQEVMDIRGRLYHKFLTVTNMPNRDEIDYVAGYCDYADEGSDYMALVVGWVMSTESRQIFIIRDILYTQDPVESYIDEAVDMLIRNEVDILQVESNNGGKGFALSLESKLLKSGGQTEINWKYNTSNKETRILTNANLVQSMIFYPRDWKEQWPTFASHVMSYQRKGRNRHDDAPDVLTMIAEDLEYGGVMIYA
jgi:predicted phage terminase large subunit-like protein